MKNLECSSRGDKRFSAFYAKVTIDGVTKSIEEWYQGCKVINGKSNLPMKEVKGKKPEFVCLFGRIGHLNYLSQWYKLLWVKYLDGHQGLVEYAKGFDTFTDMFRGKAINCQADVVKQYVKDGRASIISECQDLINFINIAKSNPSKHISVSQRFGYGVEEL